MADIKNEVAKQLVIKISFTYRSRKKAARKGASSTPVNDYLIWFAKDKTRISEAYNQLYEPAPLDSELVETFRYVEMTDGTEIAIADLNIE